LIERADHVLIRRRTVADDEGMPPLLRTTRDRHALPTAGFRFALAKRVLRGSLGASGARPQRKRGVANDELCFLVDVLSHA
jgi:hypothetical protein